MNALFIGRFQPFHLGHLDAIQQSLQQIDLLFIGIGSTTENFLPENPFTVGERIQMIKAALDEAKIPAGSYMIIPIPNINDSALWPHYIEQFLPSFETVFTSSNITETLFQNINKNRKKPYDIIKIRKNLNISSTKIRNAMLKNQKWEHLIPKSTAKLLKTWHATERIRSIQEAKK